ncbi:nuclear transport factor 2 family protein [Fredinandcohnia humi]
MEELKSFLDIYFKAWNKGFSSKNGDEIRNLMSKSFVGYWAHSGLDIPDQYDYHYDLAGVLSQYGNAHKSFKVENTSLRKNGEEYVVTGTETNTIDGIPHPAKCMFVIRKEDTDWKLVREYIELEK